MAYTTINKSTDYFNTKLYTGNGSTGHAITGVGFQPDLLWLKPRSTTGYHRLFDAVRGAGYQLYSNETNGSGLDTNQMSSFNSDGFTLGNETGSNANGTTFASWNWKANGQGSSNTDGSINTTYTSVNTTAGFSIIQYTGNGVAGATIGHGLGAVPKMLIVKQTNSSNNWKVYHVSMGNNNIMNLNDTSAQTGNTAFWNDTTPTSTLISLGTNGAINGSGNTYIMYAFTSITGYSKFGSFSGNNNNDGSFIYTGFAPSFVMVKRSSDIQGWVMWDNKRPGYNLTNQSLTANENSAEETGRTFDILSNGFKIRDTNTATNAASTYIYMAFGQTLVGSNNIPCTAR